MGSLDGCASTTQGDDSIVNARGEDPWQHEIACARVSDQVLPATRRIGDSSFFHTPLSVQITSKSMHDNRPCCLTCDPLVCADESLVLSLIERRVEEVIMPIRDLFPPFPCLGQVHTCRMRVRGAHASAKSLQEPKSEPPKLNRSNHAEENRRANKGMSLRAPARAVSLCSVPST